jgi:hypothetical protein
LHEPRFFDTLLGIVHELGCSRAWVLQRAAEHGGHHVLAGAPVNSDGIIRLHCLRAGGLEIGRLETSVAQDVELLDALVPWIGMALAKLGPGARGLSGGPGAHAFRSTEARLASLAAQSATSASARADHPRLLEQGNGPNPIPWTV